MFRINEIRFQKTIYENKKIHKTNVFPAKKIYRLKTTLEKIDTRFNIRKIDALLAALDLGQKIKATKNLFPFIVKKKGKKFYLHTVQNIDKWCTKWVKYFLLDFEFFALKYLIETNSI